MYKMIDKETYEIPTFVASDIDYTPNVAAENAEIHVLIAKMMKMQKIY